METVKYLLGILLCASTCVSVEAQSFCHLVQSAGTSYKDTITEPGTYYYSAWIYDLPMNLDLMSMDPDCSTPPELWFDLTCTPGFYSDPNIQELLQDTAKYGISVPMRLSCQTEWVDSVNAYVHHLSLGKKYRNRLQLVGIDYNLLAYVKVVVPCGGIAQIEQDTSSLACYNEARRIAVSDSTRVLANDSLNTYIFPYKEWISQADSVALYWDGVAPVRIWIAGDNCDFITDVLNTWDNYEIPAGGEYHLSRWMMENALSGGTEDTTGFFYAKIFSSEEGRIHTRPLVPETKGATMLHYDSPQQVSANGDAFYCFPASWNTVTWEANTRKIVKMYLHSSPEAEAVDSFKFDLQDSVRRVLTWSRTEMNNLRKNASGSLLFVRFGCSRDEFKLTPSPLSNSAYCDLNTMRLHTGETKRTTKSYMWGLLYDDIKGYPLQIVCVNDDPTYFQNLYIADTCEFSLNWNLVSTTNRCVRKEPIKTSRGGGTINFDSAEIAGWASKVTADGYLYVRTTADGTITFITDKPEEQDPDGDDPIEEEGTPTGCAPVKAEAECRKVMHDGQIYIIRGGKTYTITGQVVKIE